MPDTRTRARDILKALRLSNRQRDLYERGVAAMDDAMLARTTSKLQPALSQAPKVLAAARELLTSHQREAANTHHPPFDAASQTES